MSGGDGDVVDGDVDYVVARVLAGAKYRQLDEAVVRRFAAEAVARTRPGRRDEAVKYAKRKLHQAFGAFLTGSPARAVVSCVEAVVSGRADLRAACLGAMRAHASTAERAAEVEGFYAQVAEWSGPVASVADLACGLNPLAIPWMGLAPGTRYACFDIDRELQAALLRLGEIVPVTMSSETCDLVAGPPAVEADLVLLLKTLTTLEQQRAGATAAVLTALRAPQVVVSVPGRSLSGRRGYQQDPLAAVEQAAAGTPYELQASAAFGGEVVCHLVTAGAAGTADDAGAAVATRATGATGATGVAGATGSAGAVDG